jgi:hypothetical protein
MAGSQESPAVINLPALGTLPIRWAWKTQQEYQQLPMPVRLTAGLNGILQ